MEFDPLQALERGRTELEDAEIAEELRNDPKWRNT